MMQTEQEETRSDSAFSGLGGHRTGYIVYGVTSALIVYMIWIGVSGQTIPRWVLWLTTVL